MKNLTTEYLGLTLKNPIMASCSPYTCRAESVESLAKAGVSAVVLKSLFEEQIMGTTEELLQFSDSPEASDYLQRFVSEDFVRDYAHLIRTVKSNTDIKVIGSINCVREGAWLDYAREIESAGADALELYSFIKPVSAEVTAAQIEEMYGKLVTAVISKVSIPVSVKIVQRFTNTANVVKMLHNHGARGVIMFNRLYENDIDIEKLTVTASESFSKHSELRDILGQVASVSALVPAIDIAVSTGVHNGDDVIKSLLAGAKTAQLCTALYKYGFGVVGEMLTRLEEWMESHDYRTVDSFRGLMNARLAPNSEKYNRTQYVPYFRHN